MQIDSRSNGRPRAAGAGLLVSSGQTSYVTRGWADRESRKDTQRAALGSCSTEKGLSARGCEDGEEGKSAARAGKRERRGGQATALTCNSTIPYSLESRQIRERVVFEFTWVNLEFVADHARFRLVQ